MIDLSTARLAGMRFVLTATLMMSGLASTGAQSRTAGPWMDSVSTPVFLFGVSGNDADVVRVTLRVGSRIAEISARGEDVKRFGDSAVVIFTRAPQPISGASYALDGPKMRLTYGVGNGGAVIRFRLDGNIGLDVEPTLPDALRIVGILRGAAFWAVEQHRIAVNPRHPYPPAPAAGFDTYSESQVDRPASARPGNRPPTYPPLFHSAKVEGEVLAIFVVDTLGRVDTSTFHVLKSTHDLFTQAVKAAVARYSFRPAELDGRKVKQLVQMPFDFSMMP